jgi:hypothetical protein
MVLWKVSLSRFPWSHGRSSKKNRASELLPRPDPHGAGYIRPRLHLNLYYRSIAPVKLRERFAGLGVLVRRRHRATAIWFHFLEDWLDMRDLGAVLDHEEPCPIRHAIRRNNLYCNQQRFERLKKTTPAACRR